MVRTPEVKYKYSIHRGIRTVLLEITYSPGSNRAAGISVIANPRSFVLSAIRVLARAMASFSLLVLAFCSATIVSASPRNLIARGKERDVSLGEDDGPPGYSNGGFWGPASSGWESAGQHDGSWDHSSTADHPGSQYGGGVGWGYGTKCAALTVTEISTSQVAGPTVYISGSGYTATLSASTVYVSGSEHTSYIPASTITIAGPVQTSISTFYGTVTQPAAPTSTLR